MGHMLKQQRRGKGSNAYTKPPKSGKVDACFLNRTVEKQVLGEVVDFIDNPLHSAPLMLIRYEDNSSCVLIAPEGIRLGDKIEEGNGAGIALGNIIPLSGIPDGVPVCNVELRPGDGGKMARASGASATVVSHTGDTVTLLLPSKTTIEINSACRAEVGTASGGGIGAQPLMRAGTAYYMHHSVNDKWPVNRGVKMNAGDHPFGGKQHHKGHSSMTSRNAPPGAKVGNIAASRVGRRKRD